MLGFAVHSRCFTGQAIFQALFLIFCYCMLCSHRVHRTFHMSTFMCML